MDEPISLKTDVVDDNVLVMKLYGNLDVKSLPKFEEAVQKHYEAGTRKFILDCGHLGYINSMGIGSLVTLQTRLRKKEGEVKLAALQGLVADVIKVVKIDKLLNIYGDTAFAREAFAASK
ncbi:MAG: STAS domain-containing protein [Rubripirellula sp.]|nr:STAS domain-containing protein [Rubripirellula sp.]